MSKANRIGLTMRIDNNSEYDEPRNAISQDWINLVTKLGFTPILIPNLVTLTEKQLDELGFEALIMTSGGNTNIESSGKINAYCDARDVTESLVFNYALKRGFPILGVCRGMQFIYKFYGGSLYELNNKSHVNVLNEIELNNGEKRKVGCYHDIICSRDSVPKELKIWATSSDGNIEGIEHKTEKVLGIQWHPERAHPSASEDFSLIKDFLTKIDD